MKRVVITGIGIISSIGNNKKTVLSSLKKQHSGIVFSQEMKDFGMHSNVWGPIKLDKKIFIKRHIKKFMNNSAFYAYLSMNQAIKDSHLEKLIYQNNPRVGLIVGSGNSCFYNKKKNVFNPYSAVQYMTSNISACLSTAYHIYGISYSISSACATSSSCIGHAVDLILYGKQDIVFSGGSEDLTCELACGFDAMKALSVKYNDIPKMASRAYDINRDGFVISGGSGILVLEELSHALSRKARIYAEIIGIGMTSDGNNMVRPSQYGSIRSMEMAMMNLNNNSIDYINTHATSTPIGDKIELQAIKSVFKNNHIPYISSTKSITGHSLGASGVHEIIYIILMMENNFIVPSINIDHLDHFAQDMNIVLVKKKHFFSISMSNSFGFGGVNVSIIIKKYY